MNTPDFPHGMDPQNPERDDSTIRMGTSSSEENLSPDEQALRRLMKAAVQGIEPTPDALHHLRRVVPARRAHRRQLMAGAVAAGLLAIAAVPAALHAANTSGSANSNTANASSSHSNGGGGGAKGDNGKADSGRPTGSVSDGGKQRGGRKTSTAFPSATATKGGAGGPSPTSTIGAAAAHACTSGDFGKPLSYAGSAASDGTVYGWFKLSNISSTACTIAGVGSVTAVAQGSADPTRISVVDHTAGDPATGLPNGSVKSLVLASGQAYEVQFAWVPASGGGTTGCQPTTTPTPTDTPTDGTSTTSGSTAGSTATATTVPASIVLTDTSAPATAAASVTLADACAGTVYKTGVLNAT